MPAVTYPIVDESKDNPFYCPEVSASTYLEHVRSKLLAKTGRERQTKVGDFLKFQSDDSQYTSFPKILESSLTEDDWLHFFHNDASKRVPCLHDFSSSESGSELSYLAAIGTRHIQGRANPITRTENSHPLNTDRFSDFVGPPKRERSIISVNDASFELSGKAERLHFFRSRVTYSPYDLKSRHTRRLTHGELEGKIRGLEEELYGPAIGTETPRGLQILTSRLESLLPGIRLQEKLNEMDLLDHQRIVDVLASDGNLNSRVLNILRMSEVECLDLTASMTDEEGLNLDARELLHVFSKPNSFIFLNEMNLSGVQLSDTDVLHIHHLPRLSRLWISNTGIGNEAIFYLVSLKRSLTELDIAFNTGISDDAVPALILMHKLRFLTLLDTSIEMPGLRRLCAAITSRHHPIELEVPRECELYIEKLGKKYLVQPEAPLITDPHVVRDLSIAALKRNLSAHAEYNHAILAEGSREEMADRLTTLLEIRQADLIVRSILWKDDVTMVDDKDDDDYDSDDVF